MFYNKYSGCALGDLKISCLLVSLLALPLAVYAESPAPESVQGSAKNDSGSMRQQQQFSFPPWPVKKQVTREMVPPPPPGPYISSALSPVSNGETNKMPSFTNSKRNRMAYEAANFPMNSFSPDIPWPTNMRAPSRWMPDDGYSYFERPVMKMPEPMRRESQSSGTNRQGLNNQNRNRGGFAYGPQSGPVMNWPGMQYGPGAVNNNSQYNTARRNAGPDRMPSAGGNQVRPNSNTANTFVPNRAPPRQNTYQNYPR